MKPWQYVILIVVGIGVVVLIGYALKPFFMDRPDVYMWWKILMGIIIVGFVGLLEYVVIDRFRQAKKEPKRIKKAKH
jgi:H+/Cl- antiporter ClcA